MLVIVQFRICLPVYLKMHKLEYRELNIFLLFCTGVKLKSLELMEEHRPRQSENREPRMSNSDRRQAEKDTWGMAEMWNLCEALVCKYEGNRPLGKPKRRQEKNISVDLEKQGTSSGQGQVMASCEHGNEPSAPIKSRKSLDYLSVPVAYKRELCPMEWVTVN